MEKRDAWNFNSTQQRYDCSKYCPLKRTHAASTLATVNRRSCRGRSASPLSFYVYKLYSHIAIKFLLAFFTDHKKHDLCDLKFSTIRIFTKTGLHMFHIVVYRHYFRWGGKRYQNQLSFVEDITKTFFLLFGNGVRPTMKSAIISHNCLQLICY